MAQDDFMSKGCRLVSRKRGKHGLIEETYATGREIPGDQVDRDSQKVTVRAGDPCKPLTKFDNE